MPRKITTPRQRSRRNEGAKRTKSASDHKHKISAVVGIGASAGGLKAFEQFFANMPADSGVAFVLVTHLDPSHVSVLPELLTKQTKMAVVQAADGMKVKADCVYVIPPNTDMVIARGTLVLTTPKVPRGLRLPIDMFFRSLAEDKKDKAIGIILSGNGSDGTVGLKAIKAELGLAMVQEPSSAEYPGMPASAIHAGTVDYVLPPDKLATRLVTYLRHLAARAEPEPGPAEEKPPGSLPKIFRLLQAQTGHDFSLYRQNTISRRIERRMTVHQIQRLEDYVGYLERNPQEVTALFKELLIGVTSFFRDPQAFEALSARLAAEVLAGKPENYCLRVWVPGCSSGEEVYSIAMILRECMDKLRQKFSLQIFGTDIDTDAIEAARAGFYAANIAEDVGQDRLKRFFTMEEGGFRIRKEIRDMAVFAVQDVLKDPPFTKIDLLSCRNLLIYLTPELQQKLVPLFHYALKPDGILFLGSSETINGFMDLFYISDAKWKIFKRRTAATAWDFALQFHAAPREFQVSEGLPLSHTVPVREAFVARTARKVLAELYAPPTVFVRPNGEIVYMHGRTGKYLELPEEGPPEFNILQMARETIRYELAAALRKARSEKRPVAIDGLQVKINGKSQHVNITVRPIAKTEGIGEVLEVAFHEVASTDVKPEKAKTLFTPKATQRIAQLEQELKHSQEHLQTTIEELETSNEELKSSNEELQSTNEELQSTNEELQTSKEELQSLNEEIVTVNSELHGKLDDLSSVNDDLKNLLDSSKIATIFVDNQLCIKRFTSEATKIVHLIQADVGRPLSHIVTNLEEDTLSADAREVIDSLVFKEKPVRTRDGRWYLSRIIPYRTLDDVIDGTVITFTDITEQKSAELLIRDARNLAEGIVETAREPLIALDVDLHVLVANSAFYRFFQASAASTVGQSLFALDGGQWDVPKLRELLERILPGNTEITDFVVEADFPKIGHKTLLIDARRIHRDGIGTQTILLTIRNNSGEPTG